MGRMPRTRSVGSVSSSISSSNSIGNRRRLGALLLLGSRSTSGQLKVFRFSTLSSTWISTSAPSAIQPLNLSRNVGALGLGREPLTRPQKERTAIGSSCVNVPSRFLRLCLMPGQPLERHRAGRRNKTATAAPCGGRLRLAILLLPIPPDRDGCVSCIAFFRILLYYSATSAQARRGPRPSSAAVRLAVGDRVARAP